MAFTKFPQHKPTSHPLCLCQVTKSSPVILASTCIPICGLILPLQLEYLSPPTDFLSSTSNSAHPNSSWASPIPYLLSPQMEAPVSIEPLQPKPWGSRGSSLSSSFTSHTHHFEPWNFVSFLPPQFKYIDFTARYDDMKDREGWYAAVRGVGRVGHDRVTDQQQWCPVPCHPSGWWQGKPRSCVQLFVTPRTYTVHGILQSRILEWVAISFSSRYSQPKSRTGVCLVVIINNKARCLMFAPAPLSLQKSITSSLLPIHLVTRPEQSRSHQQTVVRSNQYAWREEPRERK